MKEVTLSPADLRSGKLTVSLLTEIANGSVTVAIKRQGFPVARIGAYHIIPTSGYVSVVSDTGMTGGFWEGSSGTNTFTTSGDATFTDLNAMLEAVKDVVMTPVEKEEQCRSFAHGNANIENPDVTREVIDEAADRLNAAEDEADVKAAPEVTDEADRFAAALKIETNPAKIIELSLSLTKIRKLTEGETKRYHESLRILGAAQREESARQTAKEQSVMNRMASDDGT